jgi:hypothetical protein
MEADMDIVLAVDAAAPGGGGRELWLIRGHLDGSHSLNNFAGY